MASYKARFCNMMETQWKGFECRGVYLVVKSEYVIQDLLERVIVTLLLLRQLHLIIMQLQVMKIH